MMMRSHKKAQKILSPEDVHQQKKRDGALIRDKSQEKLTPRFFNVPPVRLYLDSEREAVTQAMDQFRDHGMGVKYENAFNLSGEEHSVISSSAPDKVVGNIQFATKEDATRSIGVVQEGYLQGSWATATWLTRASILVKAAQLMQYA